MDPLLREKIEQQFGYPIEKYLYLDGVYVCIFDLYTEKYPNLLRKDASQNIIAYDKNSDHKWRIENIVKILNIPPGGPRSGYSNIWIEDNGLWCFNPIGMALRLDPKTGEVLEKKYMK